MPTFELNIFGTTHRNQRNTLGEPKNYYLFLLHILEISYTDIVLSNFDIFIKFYAFPFLEKTITNGLSAQGTTIRAYSSLPVPINQLAGRFEARKPHVLHLTGTTPTVPIDLYNCGFIPPISTQLPPNGLNPCTQPIVSSPCPNPEDFRLYSSPFFVSTNATNGKELFDRNWSNIKSDFLLNGSYEVLGQEFKLPIEVIIVANDCLYTTTDEITIYNNYLGSYDVYGGADCQFNPLGKPLGYDDKIIIS